MRPVGSAGVLGAVYTSPAIQVFADTPKPGNYIVVNTANPSNVGEFVRLQNEVWKPFIMIISMMKILLGLVGK